jgi:hypothetical protein
MLLGGYITGSFHPWLWEEAVWSCGSLLYAHPPSPSLPVASGLPDWGRLEQPGRQPWGLSRLDTARFLWQQHAGCWGGPLTAVSSRVEMLE